MRFAEKSDLFYELVSAIVKNSGSKVKRLLMLTTHVLGIERNLEILRKLFYPLIP